MISIAFASPYNFRSALLSLNFKNAKINLPPQRPAVARCTGSEPLTTDLEEPLRRPASPELDSLIKVNQ